MICNVGWLAPKTCWDQTIVRRLTTNTLYPTGLSFRHHDGFPVHADGAIISIPGTYWHQQTDQLSESLSRYSWCLAFRVSDEENLLDPNKVQHPNITWWVQTPRPGRTYPEGARLIGVGPTPVFDELPTEPPVKDTNLVLAGQNTHRRRKECFRAVKHVNCPKLVYPTTGFTQGMAPLEYRNWMLAAKIAPCPSGAVSVDSFRLWEALEAGAIPLADTVSPVDGPTTYWQSLFSDIPFPLIEDWSTLPDVVTALLQDWRATANRVGAWWMRYKRQLAHWLVEDLRELGALR